MVKLAFTLSPEACARIYDTLVCMGRFSDTVALEARKDRLCLSALNLSKSGYASFQFDGGYFFESYEYSPTTATLDGRFTCEMSNKALSAVFKGRLLDSRNKDTAIDRCDVHLQTALGEAECRFVIKMICLQGVTKTYKLTYEAVEVMHALFDRTQSLSRWSIKADYLKEFIEYFSPRTEQLDLYHEKDQVTFTSYTEKIVNANKEILKHPLQTAVTANVADFDDFEVQPQVHIAITVKDFKAIVTHADTLHCQVLVLFSRPGKPLQFSYEAYGMDCTFTLMTINNGRSAPPSAPVNAPRVSSRTSKKPEASSVPGDGPSVNRATTGAMAPPPLSNDRRPLGRAKVPTISASQLGPTQSALDSDALFVPRETGDDDDERWAPNNFEPDDGLGWDASATSDTFHATFRDVGSANTSTNNVVDSDEGLQPTQRISQIKGLF